MQVKRFVAADMRRALELVRQELGPDAIILSSNRVKEGVELLTTLAGDNELMQMQHAPLGRAVMSSSSPLMSDGAWGDANTLIAERAARQHSTAFAETVRGSASGKTGQQLADEIEQARLRAADGTGAASRSSRRRAGGRVSGHHAARWRRPAPSRQDANASGPRHCRSKPATGMSSTSTGDCPPRSTKLRSGRARSRRTARAPWTSAATASGQAMGRGISEARIETAASAASSASAVSSQRDGRHSSRQQGLARRKSADALDECVELCVIGGLVAHEPAPQPIVLAVQQA